MEREKMIETILRYMCPFFSDGMCRGKILCNDDCIKRSSAKDAINELIPDGARVLTKEELVKTMESGYVYDTTSGDKINLIEMAREIERKETASKIFSAIDKYSDKCFETVDNGVNCEPYQTFNYYKFFKWIVKFAKRFGVEV